MSYCPLISYGKQYCSEIECMGEECAFWHYSEDNCLIRMALFKYACDLPTSKEKEIETKLDMLQKQVQTIGIGFPIYNFGGGNKIE